MNNTFIDSMKKRRTQYNIGKSLPHSNEHIEYLVKEAVKHAPSAFNSQSSRVAILFGKESTKFWNLTKEILRTMVPEASYAATEQKIDGFAAGSGTILFFEDQEVIQALQEKFTLYAEHFPIWSEQSSGMAQFAVWTSLADANVGASLQHYNPLVDEFTKKTWGIPSSWKLRAQMPFGSNEQAFPEKTVIDDAARFKSFV